MISADSPAVRVELDAPADDEVAALLDRIIARAVKRLAPRGGVNPIQRPSRCRGTS